MPPLVSFYVLFVLRTFAVHHSTWFINSLAHMWGSRTYARELSAVDNAFLALLTFGEGYHNYHHTFAADYRNGIRWYHYDATKWMIWVLSKMGLARGLRTVGELRIRQRLIRKDWEMINLLSPEQHQQLRARMEVVSASFDRATHQLHDHLRELQQASETHRERLQEEIKKLRKQIQTDWKQWCRLTRELSRLVPQIENS